MDKQFTKLSPITLTFQDTNLTCPIENGHRMIPVKTVCQIIDVDYQTQDGWLKKHEFFSQLYRQSYIVAADGKERMMNCLSIFDIGYWLGSISSNNRRPGSVEKQNLFLAWLREKTMELYKSIEAFIKENEYELELIKQKGDLLDQIYEAKSKVKELNDTVKKIDQSLNDVREKRFTGQTALPFPDHQSDNA